MTSDPPFEMLQRPCHAHPYTHRLAPTLGSWCSLPQKDILGERSTADGEKFKRALTQMGSLYASLTATVVLQLQDMADIKQPELNVSFGSVLVVRIAEGQLHTSDLSNDLPSGIIACAGTLELPLESE